MSEKKMRGPVSNVIYIFRGDDVIAKFNSDTGTEGAKNPMQQAKLYLKNILGNKEHELYTDLMNGKLSTISGHPTTITPRETFTI